MQIADDEAGQPLVMYEQTLPDPQAYRERSPPE
jgi:hypothetical protein